MSIDRSWGIACGVVLSEDQWRSLKAVYQAAGDDPHGDVPEWDDAQTHLEMAGLLHVYGNGVMGFEYVVLGRELFQTSDEDMDDVDHLQALDVTSMVSLKPGQHHGMWERELGALAGQLSLPTVLVNRLLNIARGEPWRFLQAWRVS